MVKTLLPNVLGVYLITWLALRLLDVTIERRRLVVFSMIHTIMLVFLDLWLDMPSSITSGASVIYILSAIALLKVPPLSAIMLRAIALCVIIPGKWLLSAGILEPSWGLLTQALDKDPIATYILAHLFVFAVLGLARFYQPLRTLIGQRGWPKWPAASLEGAILGSGFVILASLFGSYILASHEAGPRLLSIGVCIVIGLPLLVLYFKRVQTGTRDQALLVLQREQLSVQEHAIEAMREQRHEIINDLAVISAYLQTDMYDKALQSVEFLAAKLADKYNYAELPKDAWLSTITVKKQQAYHLGIKLITSVEAESPTNFNEQRLLPKAAAILLDNAFEAVRREQHPWVKLTWRQVDGDRVLSVENNGPAIAKHELSKVFQYGYSSKSGPDRGWGLAICKRIAAELGGELSVRTSPESTKFTLFLPSKSIWQLEAAATDEDD